MTDNETLGIETTDDEIRQWIGHLYLNMVSYLEANQFATPGAVMKRVIKDWLEDLQLELFTLVVKLWLPIIDNPDDVFVETQVTYDAKSQTSTVIRRLVRDVALQRALRTDVYVGSFFGVLFESELGISLNQYRVLEDLMSDQGRTQESPAVIEKVAVLTD